MASAAVRKLFVHETYLSVQGESTYAGLPCVMVRLTGCPLRCRWCDTPRAFTEGEWRTLEEVVRAVEAFGVPLVEVTGGEPLAQPGTPALLEALLARGFRVLLETGGAHPLDGVPSGVVKIVDVKCPGSGEHTRNRWENLEFLAPHDQLKFVVADRGDYEWARDRVWERKLDRWTLLFSPVHGELDPARLAEWILEDRLPARLQVQLHKVLWGAQVEGR